MRAPSRRCSWRTHAWAAGDGDAGHAMHKRGCWWAGVWMRQCTPGCSRTPASCTLQHVCAGGWGSCLVGRGCAT
jgi:hypothetical protein